MYFVASMVLITHLCFDYCWAVLPSLEDVSSPSHSSKKKKAGMEQEFRMGLGQDRWSKFTKGIFTKGMSPDDIFLAIKSRKKKKGGICN